MIYEWDENKNKTNKAKHGVSFETAKLVFEDPYHMSIQDRYESGEERWQTMGYIGGVLLLLVAHTVSSSGSKEVIRIISARKATKQERRRYDRAK
jgi:uncharacterized DUF497 family protein